MQKIKNWRAKRAGGRITVYGVDAVEECPVRVVGVDEIARHGGGKTVAKDLNGVQYELQ